MTTTEEYKLCWRDHGINNLNDYVSKYWELAHDESFVNKFKDLNYKNFWKASHEMFGTDPVANNTNAMGKIIEDLTQIENANKMNWRAAHFCGVSGMLDLFFENCSHRKQKAEMAEIGSGYGCIFEYLKNKDSNSYEYTGFDLVPRFEDVLEVGDDGCFTDEQLEKYDSSFNLIYSFNVFQHLEKHQIERYINDSYKLLDKTRLSCMILGVCLDSKTFHYGQLIDLPTSLEFSEMIKGKFNILQVNKSYAKNQHGLHLFYLDTVKI